MRPLSTSFPQPSPRVIDIGWLGREPLPAIAEPPRPAIHTTDIRDTARLRDILRGADAIIHLAAVANDQSFDMNPTQGRAINLDTLAPLLTVAEHGDVGRFSYASSSAVYYSQRQTEKLLAS